MTYDGAAVSWTSSCVPCRGRRIAFSSLVLERVVPRPILLSINFFGPIRPIHAKLAVPIRRYLLQRSLESLALAEA